MNFESASEIEYRRKEKRKAQELILAKAKEDYKRQEKKAAAAKLSGETTWMLPELSQKIDDDLKKLKKKRKKEKKGKKEKKEKKSKVKKRNRKSSSSSIEDSENEWVEKTRSTFHPHKDESSLSDINAIDTKPHGPLVGDSQSEKSVDVSLQRDAWMTMDLSSIPAVSRQELREKIEQDKQQYALNQPSANNIDEPGQFERELNPYWKSGQGDGLPEEDNKTSNELKYTLSYLKKSYDRCEQMAEETGKPLDEIVSERFGSLENLETMIMEAERREEVELQEEKDSRARIRDKQLDHQESHRNKKSQRSRSRERRRSRSRSRDRRRSRSRSHERRRSRSRSRERRRPRSRSRDRRDSHFRRSRSRDSSKDGDRSYEKKTSRRGRSRDKSRSQERRYSHKKSATTGSRPRFMKPGELPNDSFSTSDKTSDKNISGHSTPSWKKKQVVENPISDNKALQKSMSEKLSSSDKVTPGDKAPRGDKAVFRPPSSSSASSSESDSEASEPEEDESACVLTADEMNALGAKILRAELMGDDDLAAKLQAKLESARKAKELADRQTNESKDPEEKVLLLSKADRYGNIRPVEGNLGHKSSGGKRKRTKKVETHDKSGQRERYFPDDDRFSIRDMVQSEKMTTAEDQHLMFAKMAAKISEKTDDDHQIDDAMINRARLKQDDDVVASKQQMQTQKESRRLAETLEKCPNCLDNMTKHLIIAVSKKTYLCVPGQQSLTKGHCQIIPIHHCNSATTCDEDVWNEVLMFRKALVKMFADNDDQDCVFIECVKNIRRQPHMVIDCIPLDRELGDMAPVYFKKAIQESESEWAQNKKVIDLKSKDVRHSVPRGFPYFAVDFGLQGGFAHVIEDEHTFPAYFGKEVIGGMIDVEPRLWRKAQKDSFEGQRKKVIEFAKMWRPYDFTKESSDQSESD